MSYHLPEPPRRRLFRGAPIKESISKDEPHSTASTDCDTCDTLKQLDAVIHADGVSEETPPGLRKIGQAGWTLLHTMAAYYPEEPTQGQQLMALQFLQGLGGLFPCHTCADDFTVYLEENPPVLNTRQGFSLWMCQAHNHVNEKLDKPIFPCDQVDQRWRAPPEMSIDDPF